MRGSTLLMQHFQSSEMENGQKHQLQSLYKVQALLHECPPQFIIKKNLEGRNKCFPAHFGLMFEALPIFRFSTP